MKIEKQMALAAVAAGAAAYALWNWKETSFEDGESNTEVNKSTPREVKNSSYNAESLRGDNRIDRVRPDAPALAFRGDFHVGVQTLDFTDPGRLDVKSTSENENSRVIYDRKLTVEVWYPCDAVLEEKDIQYEAGKATRNCPPAFGRFPLVIISHGFPGNRYLLSHLAENLASKGYCVASIDHLDSLYSECAHPASFPSTLLNRPLDQRFVLDAMGNLEGRLGTCVDVSRTGVIGYSMGGYGALIFGGAGVSNNINETFSWANAVVSPLLAGSPSHKVLVDPRVKALCAIGPWGNSIDSGFFNVDGLSSIRKPTLLIAGSADIVSKYESIRGIFSSMKGTKRHLLTFENAGHNAAACIPPPLESWETVGHLDFPPFEHYSDSIWDTTRMNNISQHFITAFMNQHLKEDTSMNDYLDLPIQATETNNWKGFRTQALGLRFETRLESE